MKIRLRHDSCFVPFMVKAICAAFTLLEIMIVVSLIGLLAAIAMPAFLRSRNTAQQNTCISNLRTVMFGKEQAAMEHRWSDDTVVSTTVVNEYIKGNATPRCPAGGRYDYSTVALNPSCTFDGPVTHRLQ